MTELTLFAAGGGTVVVLLAISAFVSSSEIALFSLSGEWVVEFVLSPLVFVFDGLTRRLSASLGGDEHIEEPYTVG